MSAMNLLHEAREGHQEKLSNCSVVRLNPDYDKKVDSNSPIYDAFFAAGGDVTIISKTNFSSSDFHLIGRRLEEHKETNWSCQRG